PSTATWALENDNTVSRSEDIFTSRQMYGGAKHGFRLHPLGGWRESPQADSRLALWRTREFCAREWVMDSRWPMRKRKTTPAQARIRSASPGRNSGRAARHPRPLR